MLLLMIGAALAKSPDDTDGWRGQKWGAPPTAEMKCAPDGKDKASCTIPAGTDRNIGGITAKEVSYKYEVGKLVAVMAEIPTDRCADLHRSLLSLYGDSAPTRTQGVVQWSGANTVITLGDSPTLCVIVYTTTPPEHPADAAIKADL